MNCARTRQLLDAWLDDELDASTHAEIAGHLGECPTCAARRSDRMRLRDAIRSAELTLTAPPSLAAKVQRALESPAVAPMSSRGGPSWWSLALAACLGALAGAVATFAWLLHAPSDVYAGNAVARHVAALSMADGRPERLVEIAASDRHVVKPWFQGKVDFAPPVRDLAGEGFTLLGGRLDRVDGRVAAAIVYRIRNHPLELYVWRSDAAATPLRVTIERGFGVASWTEHGLGLAAVSDVDPRDLERFARAVQGAR